VRREPVPSRWYASTATPSHAERITAPPTTPTPNSTAAGRRYERERRGRQFDAGAGGAPPARPERADETDVFGREHGRNEKQRAGDDEAGNDEEEGAGRRGHDDGDAPDEDGGGRRDDPVGETRDGVRPAARGGPEQAPAPDDDGERADEEGTEGDDGGQCGVGRQDDTVLGDLEATRK
jgi:hypothetical protein